MCAHLKRPIAVLLILLSWVCSSTVWSQSRPNVIFIFSDDHAYQAIGAYGNRLAKTPNIDRIAREGAILTNNLVTNSICGPSRATLLTGKFSHKNGYPRNDHTLFDVGQTLFPKVLQQNGYQTAWVGKMHLNSLPAGFDYWNILPGQGRYFDPQFIGQNRDTTTYPGYVSDRVTEFSLDWLEKREESKPFFLIVGHKATHREWFPDLQDLGAYDQVKFPVPTTFYDDYKGREAAGKQDMTIHSTMLLKNDLKVGVDYDKDWLFKSLSSEQKERYKAYFGKRTADFESRKRSGRELAEWKYQQYMRDYLSTANSLDRNIGKLLNYLDQKGLSKNTVVIYASDQGFYLGEHGWFDKRFIYEQSLKTPFVIRYPGVVKPGTKVDQLIANIDWAPTVLDIAGAKAPADMQGRSFLSLLKPGGKSLPWRQASYYHYYEFPKPHHVYPHFGVRTARYTLVRFYGGIEAWELYDLQKDPDQVHNIYGKSGTGVITTSLKEQLKKLIVEYEDHEALRLLE